MHDDAPRQMILGVFGSSERADDVRRQLRRCERRRLIDVLSLSLIRRDAQGRLDVVTGTHDDDWLDDERGPLPTMLRLMVGPTRHASSFSRLHGLAGALTPNASAIAAVIEHRWVEDIRALMEEAGAEAVGDTLMHEIELALAQGRDIVLTTGGSDWSLRGSAPV